jgi:hypothetical protein
VLLVIDDRGESDKRDWVIEIREEDGWDWDIEGNGEESRRVDGWKEETRRRDIQLDERLDIILRR